MNRPFDRELYNTLERALSPDNNVAASYADLALREVLKGLFNKRMNTTLAIAQSPPAPGFLGEGFQVRGTGPASYAIQITPGIGFFGDTATASAIGGITGVDDLSAWKPLVLSAPEIIALAPNATAFTRLDLIEVRTSRALADNTARQVLTPGTGIFAAANVDKTLTWALDGLQGQVITPAASTTAIGYKVGIAAGVPVEPPVTLGYVPLGYVLSSPGGPPILLADIQDRRTVLRPYGQYHVNLAVTVNPGVTATLNRFDGPPGLAVPVVSTVVAGNRHQLTVAFSGAGVATDSLRVTAVAQIESTSDTIYPLVTVRSITVPSANSLTVVFQSILPTFVGQVMPQTLTAHPNPTIFRVMVSYW